jgi:nicotinamidase-related amidase
VSGGLLHGPLGPEACHVAIDMQVFFASGSEWAVPDTLRVLPVVERLARHAPASTIFTRFMPPRTVAEAHGQWQTYYRRWSSVLRQANDTGIYDLLLPLRELASPAQVVDKSAYSAFESVGFCDVLSRLGFKALILTGIETDVCVLATALDAVDRGLRVVMVSDGLGSGSETGHSAILQTLAMRYDEQVEIVYSSTILERWRP